MFLSEYAVAGMVFEESQGVSRETITEDRDRDKTPGIHLLAFFQVI